MDVHVDVAGVGTVCVTVDAEDTVATLRRAVCAAAGLTDLSEAPGQQQPGLVLTVRGPSGDEGGEPLALDDPDALVCDTGISADDVITAEVSTADVARRRLAGMGYPEAVTNPDELTQSEVTRFERAFADAVAARDEVLASTIIDARLPSVTLHNGLRQAVGVGVADCFVRLAVGRVAWAVPGVFLLHAAAEAGDAAGLQRLVDLYIDEAERSSRDVEDALTDWMAERDLNGVTPLLLARNAESVYVCMQYYAEAAQGSANMGWTRMHVAAGACEVAVVDMLLRFGADANLVDFNSVLPLHAAAAAGHEATLRALLPVTRGLDRPDYLQRTPLSLAAMHGHARAVTLIHERSVAVGTQLDLHRAVHAAAGTGRVEACQALFAAMRAAAEGDGGSTSAPTADHGVRELLNTVHEDEGTPLHAAVRSQRQEMVALLLAEGASPDVVDTSSRGPLHAACRVGNTHVTRALLAHGVADLNARDTQGEAALHSASLFGFVDVVELLVAAGADVAAVDQYRATPLHYAARANHEATAAVLVAAGADVYACDVDGDMPYRLGSLDIEGMRSRRVG